MPRSLRRDIPLDVSSVAGIVEGRRLGRDGSVNEEAVAASGVSPGIGIDARRLVVSRPWTACGKDGAELVLTALDRMIFERFSGDWVSVGGARKLIEADGQVGCMTLPIVPDGVRQEIELLEALAVRDEFALRAGRGKLDELQSDHYGDNRGADKGDKAVTTDPRVGSLDFAQAAEVIPEDAARKDEDDEALREEAGGKLAAEKIVVRTLALLLEP